MASPGTGSGQEFCLKWNNHQTTILSVMDTLLEEESLVDVTLSADGQFLRAHRVILSACSPYFRTLFKSSFLNEKHPVIIMKDVDFDNLKALVEYMYKGEANVPQKMLPSFISTAESLQVRGLAEGASKQKLEQVAELNQMQSPPHLTVPSIPVTPQITTGPPFAMRQENHKKPNKQSLEPSHGGILAARLAKMVENPPMQMFDFHEQLAMAARNSSVPPPMKKSRKSPATSSPNKVNMNGIKKEISVKKDLMARNVQLSPKTSNNIMAPTNNVSNMVSALSIANNNDESDSDVLKIDEDGDYARENKENKEDCNNEDEIPYETYENQTYENGMDDSEEEIAMGGKELVERAGTGVGFINPWTGEELPGEIDHDEDSLHGEGPIFPSIMDHSSFSRSDLEEKPMMNDPMPNKYSCARCGRSYLHQATLVRHQRYECGISASYPCPLCGRKFKRRDVLKGHMEKCINKANGGPLPNAVSSNSMLAITNTMSISSPLTSMSPLPLSSMSPLTSMSPLPLTSMSPMTTMSPLTSMTIPSVPNMLAITSLANIPAMASLPSPYGPLKNEF